MSIQRIKSEFKLHIFICTLVFSLFVINAVSSFGSYVGVESSLVSNASKILLAALFILIIKENFWRIPTYAWRFSVIAGVVILINISIFPQNYQFPTTIVTFCSMCLTVYLVGSLITDFVTLMKYLLATSLIISFISLLLVTFNSIGVIRLLNEWGNSEYSMGLGNACTIPALILLWSFFNKKNIWYLVPAAIMVLTIISFGSRGPLLPIILFIGLMMFKGMRNVPLKLFLIVVLIISYVFLNDILYAIGGLLHSVGINSRTIDLLFTSGVEEMHMSGRDSIYAQLLPIIENNPFEVRGINAEWNILEIYAHNIFIEIIYQFGYLIGIPFIIFILYRVVRTAFNQVSNEQIVFTQIFMFSAFCQSLVSGSLWTLPYFWLWFSLYNRMNAVIQKN